MPSLTDIPLEIFIDNILPLLPLNSIQSLTQVNKDFALLCSDDTFWKRKVKEDYNFSDIVTARTKGYKFLYKGIHNAKTYVWGSTSQGRLGLGRNFNRRVLQGGITYPKHLNIPGPRIVDLAASGWAFHAIDSEGGVHVWAGQLDGEGWHSLEADPFSEPRKQTSIPVKLSLPEAITNITCGRAHATALSAKNRVWVFTNWGAPYVLTTELLDPSSDFSTPLQVESGWNYSAVLTRGGDVYLFWPFKGKFQELDKEKYRYFEGAEQSERPHERDGVVDCRPWEIALAPIQAPHLNIKLPTLREGEKTSDQKIIKIAAGDRFLIGLTDGGHVLWLDLPDDDESFHSQFNRPRWEYLPQYSEYQSILNHETFKNNPDSPPEIKITHISAHFMNFFAYSTGDWSVVLQGHRDNRAPQIKPSLQNRDVIAVVQGDYHFGALTSTGKLLTWGAYSSGAPGLGDPTRLPVGAPGGFNSDRDRERATARFGLIPPEVAEPIEVKFGTKGDRPGRESFVFKATASGWHTGALVINLEVCSFL
ncbi:hypothetical protein M422DRAFT_161543 [Sphaerobolus stellatus SS14]|nr:hypothetical protein M422DRAFT_161543 [Sphaerobolus stellatus SS14]